MRSNGWFPARVFAVLGLLGTIAGCGAGEESNVTVSSALLQNSPYLQGQTLVARAGSGAGATIFQAAGQNPKAFYSYIRSDSHIGIVIDTNLSNGGGQSGSTYTLSDMSGYGAALFSFGGFLDLFYVGTDLNLYMRQSSDGVNWGSTILLNSSPYLYIPAPVSLNGSLSLFVVSTAHQIIEVPIVGTQIIGETLTTGSSGPTNRGVTAATWNGQVYLSWAGTDSNNTIHIQHNTRLSGFDSWSANTTLAVGGYPALISLTNQTMELVFRGNDSHIYRVYTSDGVSFGAPTRDNASTTNQKPMAFMAQGASDAWVYYIGVNNGLFATLE